MSSISFNCSFDVYVGQKAFNSTLVWAGAQGMRQFITEALTPHAGLRKASDIFVYGGSAGSLALLNYGDELFDTLLKLAPKASIRMIADSSWFVDMPSFNASLPSVLETMDQGVTLWGATPSLRSDCVRENKERPGLCLSAPHVYRFIQHRDAIFWLTYSEDLMEILYGNCPYSCSNTWLSQLRQMTWQTFSRVEAGLAFDCQGHIVVGSQDYGPNGTVLNSYLYNYLQTGAHTGAQLLHCGSK